MQFNTNECKVLGMGKNNENRSYVMQGEISEHVTPTKDMAVVIDMVRRLWKADSTVCFLFFISACFTALCMMGYWPVL